MAAKSTTTPISATPTTKARKNMRGVFTPTPAAMVLGYNPLDSVFGFPVRVNCRYTLVLQIEVIKSNPNGDPDRNGAPRVDVWGHGEISAASAKRNVRDEAARNGATLYVSRDEEDLGLIMAATPDLVKLVASRYDLRAFGGALTALGGKVLGAWQTTGGRSVLPVNLVTVTNTRVISHSVSAAATAQRNQDIADGKDVGSVQVEDRANMGSREVVDHAVYTLVFHFDPYVAAENGFTEDDMRLFYSSLIESWANNRSSARPEVNLRRATLFQSDLLRGSESPHVLAKRVMIAPKTFRPSSYEEYAVKVNTDGLSPNVHVYEWTDSSEAVNAAAAAFRAESLQVM